MSPRRSPTTKVLPSRTLSVRSDKRGGSRALVGYQAVGLLVGARDDVSVAVLGYPGAAVARGDAREVGDSGCHPQLVIYEEPRFPIEHELDGGALTKGDHRRAAGERLDHDHPEGLLPADRHEQRP